MKNILENNTVIITGASKKIGKAIVKKLSLEEANLVLLDKGEEEFMVKK